MSLVFDISYKTQNNTKKTENFHVHDLADYDGECQGDLSNTLLIDFKKNWHLELNYTLSSSKTFYELSSILFKYVVEKDLFPDVADSELGPKLVFSSNRSDFSANKGNSYKCFADSKLTLSDDVAVEVSNYQAQPFLADNEKSFDTAIECEADIKGTSKLVPIIVGSALALLVIMVLVAYIIGRRKHRPGYQQV